MSDNATDDTERDEERSVELNGVVLNQRVAGAAMANALGLRTDQIEGVYEVPNGIKVIFRGDCDGE